MSKKGRKQFPMQGLETLSATKYQEELGQFPFLISTAVIFSYLLPLYFYLVIK